jgi:hypothetical protein
MALFCASPYGQFCLSQLPIQIAHIAHILLTNVSVMIASKRVWAIMGNLWVKHGQFSKAQLPILFYPQIDLHFTLKLASKLLTHYPHNMVAG